MAIKQISHISVYVKNQNEALRWYTEKLGFIKRDDDSQTMSGFRWLTVSPKDNDSVKIMLFDATQPEYTKKIGQGTMVVLDTGDCRKMCAEMKSKGVTILSGPEDVPWGVSAVFKDLYGNPYNLVERKD